MQRDKKAKSACVIRMKDSTTEIVSPENGDVKSFSFDYSYWSHDGYVEKDNGVLVPDATHENGANYADQVRPPWG